MSSIAKNTKNKEYKPVQKFKPKKSYESLVKAPDEEINIIAKYNHLNNRIHFKIDELISLHRTRENYISKNYLNLSELMLFIVKLNHKVRVEGLTINDVAILETIFNKLYPEID
jgi:hypothetical protein